MAAGWREPVLRYATHGVLLLGAGGRHLGPRGLSLGFVGWLSARATLNPAALPARWRASTRPRHRRAANDTVGGMLAARRRANARPPSDDSQVARLADGHTLIPTRGRSEVITYTVSLGRHLFGIADKFGLKPETVLWGNYFVLKDDPHLLFPEARC